jgi:hypothetical protein
MANGKKQLTSGKEAPGKKKAQAGYGNPPMHTRFKKGHSGNPTGRPKGSLNRDVLLNRIVHKKLLVREDGKRKKVTKLEANYTQLVNKAAQGHLGASAQLQKLLDRAEAKASSEKDGFDEDFKKFLREVAKHSARHLAKVFRALYGIPEGNGLNVIFAMTQEQADDLAKRLRDIYKLPWTVDQAVKLANVGFALEEAEKPEDED